MENVKNYTMEDMIEEVSSLRGASVEVFGQATKLNSEVKELEIDTVEILKAIDNSYDCSNVEYIITQYYEDDEDEYESKESDAETWFQQMDDIYGMTDFRHDNTYNWDARVTNHIDYAVYKCGNGWYYLELKTHLYGDVRGNYTESVWYELTDECSFTDAISEVVKHVDVEVYDEHYFVTLNVYDNYSLEVYNDNWEYITNVDCYDMEELIEGIREYVE